MIETPGVTIAESYKIEDTRLLYGTDVNFIYKGKNYQWHRTGFVYLMEDKEPNNYRLRDETKIGETDKYYCFNTTNLSNDEIIDGLLSLRESLVTTG